MKKLAIIFCVLFSVLTFNTQVQASEVNFEQQIAQAIKSADIKSENADEFRKGFVDGTKMAELQIMFIAASYKYCDIAQKSLKFSSFKNVPVEELVKFTVISEFNKNYPTYKAGYLAAHKIAVQNIAQLYEKFYFEIEVESI